MLNIDNQKKLYYVTNGKLGITLFNLENDTTYSINASRDKSKWIKFTYEEAEIVYQVTKYDIIEIY